LGWDFIPPTVLRQDGPAGAGSLQLYIDVDSERHYFTFSEKEKRRLRPVALLDVLMNNADRKGGHILMGPDGHIWLIDHGLCFHEEPKLRTVIWDFAAQPIDPALLTRVEHFRERLSPGSDLWHRYCELLSERETDALVQRAEHILETRRFPDQAPGRPYPWPLV
jgi:uncharacterized repeat protein (TIGR03843 family)